MYNKDKNSENISLYGTSDNIMSLLFGVAVGDALGVPYEFRSGKSMLANPATGMTGYGTYNLPPGTWSDDSSLTFCLAEALTHDYDLKLIGLNFVKWWQKGYWTARGKVFDIGNATRLSLNRLAAGESPEHSGSDDPSSNGNGSLMRIAPLLFYIMNKPANERFLFTSQVSSITHSHIRSVIACYYYLEFARQLLKNKDKYEIYLKLQTEVPQLLSSLSISSEEITLFNRLLKNDISSLPESEISGSGYVLHTLEASVWCLLNTGNYRDAVLKAVNLGEDTDTTAAVTGGLAGLLYGIESIPEEWLKLIARSNDIEDLALRLHRKCRI